MKFIYSILEIVPLAKARAYKVVPSAVKRVVKYTLRKTRRFKALVRKKVTKESLFLDFQRLGINPGDVLMVHSSMSRLGNIENGPDDVIDALLEVVGKEGTIAVPTFSWATNTPGDFTNDSKVYFDVSTTPSGVGKITEIFRHRKDALRSCHPTHSVAAIGRHAEHLTDSHHKCSTPFGKGSPFDRMLELDGKWLFLGVDIDKFTIYHVFEDICEYFPYKVYHDDTLIVRARDKNGIERIIRTRMHDYYLSLTRIDNDKSGIVLTRVKKRFSEMGILRAGTTGETISYIVGARAGLHCLQTLLDLGETIYLSEEEKERLGKW